MSAGGRNDPCPCGSGRKAKHCCMGGARSAGAAAGIVMPLADGLEPQRIPLAQAVLLAQSRQRSGDLAGAEKIYNLILAVDPDHGDALFFLGLLRHQMGKSKEAFGTMQHALRTHPKVFKYQLNFGIFCDEMRAYDDAMAAFRRAIEIEPQSVAWSGLGKVQLHLGQLDDAVQSFRHALRLQPHGPNSSLHNNLAGALQQQGKLEEAMEHYRIVLELEPHDPALRSNYLYGFNFLPRQDLAAAFAAHREFGTHFDRPMTPPPRAAAAAERLGRPLRVGYVSPDFRQHSVAHFIEPVLAAHDRSRVEPFCYSNNSDVDEVTRRLRALSPNWRVIHQRPFVEVAELIRADGIDILVDLAGHTAHNSLPIFGLKPAPVQVTWLGYPNTTGMTTMDWRITDRFADPPGESDSLHTERLYRMPECFLCFQAPSPCPEVGPLPAAADGRVTFASFNNFAKTTPQVIALWARVLRRVPGARIVLKNKSMEAEDVRRAILAQFAQGGVDASRVEMTGPIRGQSAHLERYNQVDVALDSFPYNGTTTTFEALWMGVPVVTLEGRSHVSRVGVSQMHNLGMPELVARDADDYVEIAARLAGDLPRLAALRASLRERLRASPLMDAPRFTRNLEAAFTQMWNQQAATR
jgi:predicted O-linked N-acetylglucosamine transferase (SPINDLY family)